MAGGAGPGGEEGPAMLRGVRRFSPTKMMSSPSSSSIMASGRVGASGSGVIEVDRIVVEAMML